MQIQRAPTLPAWSSDFCIGHGQVDISRRKLLELAQKALDLSRNDPLDVSRYHYLLNEVAQALRICAEKEENFLTKSGFADMAKHSTEHASFWAEIAELLCLAANDTFDAPVFARLLGEYVRSHVLVTDLLAHKNQGPYV